MEHPKFRAAFDLLSLRAEIERNQELQRLAQWWAEFGFPLRRNRRIC